MKLVVPARAVGLEGKTVNGMAFSQHGGPIGGRVTWDKAGKESASVDDLLSLLKGTGRLVTDTRPDANTPAVPRINVGAALGVSELDQAWIAEYYNNLDLNEEPVLRRREEGKFLDRYFNGASPAPGFVGAENYSVRWTRTLTLSQGNYRFSVTGDDGVRLYINGESKIPADAGWGHHPSTTYNVDEFLESGNYEIKLEYFQGAATAQVRLHWGILNGQCSQNAALDHWQGEYFNNAYLLGSPVVRQDDGLSNSLNFNWEGGAPPTGCNLKIFPDNFSVRWTGTANFAHGKYRFTVSGDNGVRLKIDGVVKFERWTETVGTNTIEFEVLAGDRTIVLEYFETFGGASVSLSWVALPPTPPSNPVATAVSPSQINLSWDHTGNFVNGFKIERLDGGGWTQINMVGRDARTHADSGRAHSTTYSYRVRAFNNGGDSGPSDERSATTLSLPPSAPSDLFASALSESQISLSWTDTSSNETGFKIEEWNGSSYAPIATVGANVTSYTAGGLLPSTNYMYRVRAFNNGGDSGPSNVSNATTSCSAPVGHSCQ